MNEQVEDAEIILASAPGDEYEGPVEVSTGSATLLVQASLRGRFEPLDGLFHWYGRIAANDQLTETVRSGETVVLTTGRGSAEGRVSDVDAWGRFRIAGTGRPPFG
jgi:hypothetical protein